MMTFCVVTSVAFWAALIAGAWLLVSWARRT